MIWLQRFANKRCFLFHTASLLVLGMIFLFFQCRIAAQTLDSSSSTSQPPHSDIGAIIVGDLNAAWSDGLRYFSAPARFTGRDWAITAATLGASAALLPADEPLNAMMLRNRSAAADALAAVGREYGGVYGMALGGVVYGAGFVAGSGDVRVTGRLMLQALLYAGLTTTVLKSAFGRSRPYREEGAFQFHPPQFDDSRLSLPSGHATVAFALSSVLARAHWQHVGKRWTLRFGHAYSAVADVSYTALGFRHSLGRGSRHGGRPARHTRRAGT
jgi:membrane-associated phospholipid phosphatase